MSGPSALTPALSRAAGEGDPPAPPLPAAGEGWGEGAAPPLPTPILRPCIDLWVEVGTPIEVGDVGAGLRRRVIPITGGRAVGLVDGWEARILPAGADFQTVAAAGFTTLHARYVLETTAGDRLYVENDGVRSGPPEQMEKLLRGEPVDPADIYFRTAPRFEAAAAGPFAWMTERLFVGVGMRRPTQVVMRFFEVR